MNINLNYLSQTSFPFFKDAINPLLTLRNKTICLIAVLAFSCLAACYYAIKYYDADKKKTTSDIERGIDHESPWKGQTIYTSGKYKKEWKSWVENPVNWKKEAQRLQLIYEQSSFHSYHNPLFLYDAPVGKIYWVPNQFSMWMSGVAFIASYLAEKKNIQGLFVCQTLEAFSTRIKEIALSDSEERCAFIVGIFASGFKSRVSFGFEPNFPQHKVAVCVEKKEGKLTIALLESQPIPGKNSHIDPTHLTDEIWLGYEKSNKFNLQELVFRAIFKACRSTNCHPRLLHSNIERQKSFGCYIFALQSAFAYLRDPEFFNRITCSTQRIEVDTQDSIESILVLPPDYMVGTQSTKLLTDYKDKVGPAIFNQPLLGKQKSLQNYLDIYLMLAPIEGFSGKVRQNHYVTKKNFKYLNLLINSLDQLEESKIRQMIGKTLITKIDKNLFPLLS